jgi:hypothetical protein
MKLKEVTRAHGGCKASEKINTLGISEFTEIVRNEILHAKCTTRNATVPLYMFKSEHSL